jgi:phage terminase large subunit-like protein
VSGWLGSLEAAGVLLHGGDAWERFLGGLKPQVRRAVLEEWAWQAHGGQREPVGEWRTWLLMPGRGFGKTLAGAHWVAQRARECPGARIALVGGTRDDVVKVMVEGRSGLLSVARCGEAYEWVPTQGVLSFGNGSEAFVYSAGAAEKLRGPEHHFAWCDELAKWDGDGRPGRRNGSKAWDNLQMGLRLGERPRGIVTTTPRSVALVRRVREAEGTVETGGRTAENGHAPEAFVRWAVETYGGTRLGRQELDGVLFEDAENALWTRAMLEAARVRGPLPAWKRVVVGVDPPASAGGDACGIVVCAMGEDGILYVLADCTVSGLRPEGWAAAVCRAAERWGADRVVAEKNQGGDMVESVLRGAGEALPVRLVHAARGKVARAEPVAAQFERGKAKLAGSFPELEDELAGLSYGGGYQGPGGSPDRADAMVWAMTELDTPHAEPRVRSLW